MGNVVAIVSGKGGTGKTTLTAGLGAALARMNRKVLCIDCDIGLRGLDMVLGMSDAAVMDFSDVMAGRCDLSLAAVPHPTLSHLHLLTAPLSLPAEFSGETGFCALLREARRRYDDILLDSPAGLGVGFRLAVCDADKVIVVVTDDSPTLRAAQAVVGKLPDPAQAHLVMNRMKRCLPRRREAGICDAMDTVGLPFSGLVPEDKLVQLAVREERPLTELTQRGAATAYENIARRLCGEAVLVMRSW